TPSTGEYATLPQPYTTYATGQPGGVPDTRFPTNLPNGPFQISRYVPYPAYTGDPVHRFFQMWQDVDGGRNDKFVWVEETIGTGSNGAPPPAGGFNPKEGAISMGFYNMNPFVDAKGQSHDGDAQTFKFLADTYSTSHYYLVNNYNMFWNQTSSAPRTLGPDQFTLPPQSIPTIADVMTQHHVSWKYYSGDRGDDATVFKTDVDGVPLLFHSYCGICDPL